MTDEELIARLRDGCNLQQRDGERGAKRIEQLIATNEDLISERHEWMKDSAAAWDKCEARRIDEEVLEAKLTKAVEALQLISQMHGYTSRQLSDIARTVLAELEGK